MTDQQLVLISNKQLREQSYIVPNDKYGMASVLNLNVRRTMLACPNVEDEKTAAVLAVSEQVVIGRALQLGSCLQLGDVIVKASAGGGRVEVAPEYRGKGVCTSMINWRINNLEYDYLIGALYSTMMLPILKKMGFVIFEKPLFIYFKNLKPRLRAIGLSGALLSICAWIANVPLRVLDLINWLRRVSLQHKFVIIQEQIVPKWAGEMSMKDGHKFQEVHDQAWLQWNLDNNLNGHQRDIQSYYSIYDKKTSSPLGFFLTKERFEESAGHYCNVIKGTVCEWASADKRLTEADIHLLSLSKFSPDVFYINAIASEPSSIIKFIRMGFVRHGNFQVSFYDKKKQLDEQSRDVSNWRIRYGYANSIIC